jgi:hypothetical protein
MAGRVGFRHQKEAVMRRTFCTVGAILALVFLVAVAAEANKGFSVKDVDGPTAFDFDGFAGPSPAAAVGRFVADGHGNITDGVRTLVIGGVTFHQTFECTYTVNPNGTGTATCTVMTGTAESVETFDFVIVEKKKEAFFTSTTSGVTVRGRTKRQH